MATLKMAIDARNLIHTAKRVETTLHGVKSAAHTSFHGVKRAADIALGPLKAMVAVSASIKASMIAVGMASIGAAGQYEMFHQQLRTVIKDKEDADRAFRESIVFSVVTPFTPEQIIQTRLELEAVGVRGSDAVKRVAQAAAGMKREISDVAAAVKSMEVEPLRNLGIMMDQLYERGVSKEFRQSTEEFRAAQQILLEMFEEKYGGGLQRMSLTWQGLISTLKGAVFDLRAEFGEGFLDESKLFVQDLIEGAAKLKEYAREAGKEFGDEMLYARAALLSGFDVALKIAGQIKEAMKQEGGMGTVILASLELGATLLGKAIYTAFEVSLPLWKTIGTILGQGILSAIYRSNIPGAGVARRAAIESNLVNQEFGDLKAMAQGLGLSADKKMIMGEYGWEKIDRTKADYAQDISQELSKRPIEEQLRYAEFDPAEKIVNNLTESKEKLTQVISGLGPELASDLQDTMIRYQAAAAGIADSATLPIEELKTRLEKEGVEIFKILDEYNASFDKYYQDGGYRIRQWQSSLDPEDMGSPFVSQAAPDVGAGGVGGMQEITKEHAEAVSRMYEQMGDYGEEYMRMQKVLLRTQMQEYAKYVDDKVLLEKWYNSQVEQIGQQITDKERDASYQRSQIISQMYSDMGQYGYEYFEAQKQLLDMQLEEWEKFGIEQELLAEYRSISLKKQLVDSHEGLQVLQRALNQTESNLSNFLYNMQRDFDSVDDHFKELGRSMVDTFQRAVADMIAKWIMFQAISKMPGLGPDWAAALGFSNPLAGIGGGGGGGVDGAMSYKLAQVPHKGGLIGYDTLPTRMVDSALFTNAPRLHNGLRDDEYPAILQRGETVNRRGQSGNVNLINKIEVINQSGKKVDATIGDSQFDGEGYVTQVILKDITNNGPIAQTLDRR